ncbi:MAG: hypothetical protein ACRDNK_18685 [Solirubrobacteraceae bacterium]
MLVIAGCGGSHHRGSSPSVAAVTSTSAASVTASVPRRPPRARRLIAVLSAAHHPGVFGWRPAVAVRGQTAVWISRVNALHKPGYTVTLVRLNQGLVTLALHAGGLEPGGRGWRYGDAIRGAERRILVAAFNSGFREHYGAGGFAAYGRVGWRLRRGAASLVIYRDGTTDIGRWREGVPAPGHPVAAVRQNLALLINGGHIAPTVDNCIKRCWGDPLHEQPVVARSGLGITSRGDLIWAAGYALSVRALATALAAQGVVRAMELDINPRWVAGYVYAHPRHARVPVAVPLMSGQTGIPGQFLTPYFRDFLSVITRPGS